MALSIKFPPYKHEYLSLDLNYSHVKDRHGHIHLRPQVGRWGRNRKLSELSSQPVDHLVSSGLKKRPSALQKVRGKTLEDTWYLSLVSTHMYTFVFIHTFIFVQHTHTHIKNVLPDNNRQNAKCKSCWYAAIFLQFIYASAIQIAFSLNFLQDSSFIGTCWNGRVGKTRKYRNLLNEISINYNKHQDLERK